MSKTKEQGIGKGPSKIPSHQNPSGQDRIWYSMWKDNSPELRKRAILWRKQNAATRVDRPSRLLRARRLGYKAKQGIVVIRMRVGAGGMRKQDQEVEEDQSI